MSKSSTGRRPRRQFSDEFMVGAVRLVLDEGKTVGAVARELDLTPSALAGWVRHARADRTNGKTGLTSEERAELTALRKENRQLRMERDILKQAAAFFATHHDEAKMELFDYIEVFYNQRRRHSTLGQISPAAFERRATA